MPHATSPAPRKSLKGTKEMSCANCRTRKVRCTGGRPACEQCLKASAMQGVHPSRVRCLYSGASQYAKSEDREIEAKLGGVKAQRCLWGGSTKVKFVDKATQTDFSEYVTSVTRSTFGQEETSSEPIDAVRH
ncbi:Zn(II)2Cys6 transcription factor domain-containing protein [Sporobolomyces koalae]|uniref:Zn(II)2Cys6 transcription factor domain-containing protein n=1 Tax=Sporobolomyces koalae TaxID=500713 RepID=UPI00317F9D61